MTKKAICIRREDAHIDFGRKDVQAINPAFWKAPAQLVDRELCETDESLLQIIPYIVVRDHDGRILTYRRGSAGDEGRLHDRLSIGIGGHMDVEPNPDATVGLRDAVRAEGRRELCEEIGMDVDIDSFDGLIYDGSDAVGRVHLGLVCSTRVDGDRVLHSEPGIVDGLEFRSLADLLESNAFERLENWSRIVVTDLREAASLDIGSVLDAVREMLLEISVASPTGLSQALTRELAAAMHAVAGALKDGDTVAVAYDADYFGTTLRALSNRIRDAAESQGIPL